MQTAMGMNIAQGASSGWQNALFINIASGELQGAQTALVNVAEGMNGLQTGLVNHAASSKGLQVGLVNSGGNGRGLQIGIVNVAGDYDGGAIGLVTVHKKGYNHVFVNSGTMDPFVVGASWGSRYIYTNVQLGARFKANGSPSAVLAVGGHLPIRKFYIDGDVGGGYRFSGDLEGPVVRARIQPGFELGPHFAIQTGLVIEAQSALGLVTVVDPDPGELTVAEVGRTVGWTVGLRF
jgi:hypothetical protein